jgi:beta-lactamase regulating signal transducer with metallopeptidase domain
MLTLLAGAALRSLFLAAAVGAGLRLRRIHNPLVALAAWTLVLATSLLMPVAMRLTSIALPNGIIPNDLVPDSVIALARLPLASEATEAAARTEVWLVYLAVFGALMLRLLSGLVLSWRITRAATPISEAWVEGFDVRCSRWVDAPATVGSVILLPADHMAWTPARRLAVLAHEGAHVARRDFAIQLAASVNRAVFWFNPLSWWLRRHLADLAEAASDDAAIARLNDRFAYAEILLEIAGRVRALPGAVAMGGQAAVASRIKRILAETPPPSDVSRHGRVLLAAGIVPLAALLCLLVVPPMPVPPMPQAAQPSAAVELASAQPASTELAAAEPVSGESAAAQPASAEQASAASAAAEPASAQPAPVETASGADGPVDAKQPAAAAIAAEAMAAPPLTLAQRTEAESPPPSVAAMPPPPSQAAARTPPRHAPPATTKNALRA